MALQSWRRSTARDPSARAKCKFGPPAWGRFAGMVLLLSIISAYSNASPADGDLPDRTATPRASPPEDQADILQVRAAVCFDNQNLS